MFTVSEWERLADELILSPRQVQIIECLFDGLGDRKISERTGITVPTVRTHFSRLFNRFNIQDRNELILFVFRQFRSHCSADECPRKTCRNAVAMV